MSPRRLAETIVSTIAAPFLRLQYTITQKVADWRSSRLSYYQMSKLTKQLQEQNKTLLQEIIALHGQLWFSQAAEELILFKKRNIKISYIKKKLLNIIKYKFFLLLYNFFYNLLKLKN